MSTKALKKELVAAVIMVLVAAIALSGSTFAWFANNDSVTANMSSITAKTDAAFLQIATSSALLTSTSSSSVVNISSTNAIALYPARYSTDSATKLETAYGQSPDSSDIKSSTLTDVALSVLDDYAWVETVYVKAQSGTFYALEISDVDIAEVLESSGLISAGRIMAICEDTNAVSVWKDGSLVTGASILYAADFSGSTYVTIKLYFYYDGDDSNIKTNNFTALKPIKSAVTFTAKQRQ